MVLADAGDVAGSSLPGAHTLSALGEDAVLARILPRLRPAVAALIGPGDDGAVVAASGGRFVVSTDTMVHGPDFRLAWHTPRELGWKAAATNLTDIAAMGARPTAMTVAITAPSDTDVVGLEGIAEGIQECLDALAPGAGGVGGDLTSSPVLTIAVTVFGDLAGEPVRRSGARVGDIVAHAGPLRARHPDRIAAQLAPRPPVLAGVAAALAGATAMIDVSDGLARDARRVAVA